MGPEKTQSAEKKEMICLEGKTGRGDESGRDRRRRGDHRETGAGDLFSVAPKRALV